MKLIGFFLLILTVPLVASAQTPTLVQHSSCPNSSAPPSGGSAQSSTPDYFCPLPESSQSGNAILVAVTSYSGGAPYSVGDDKGNSYLLVDSVTDGNSSFNAIYLASNVTAGTRTIQLHGSNSAASNAAVTVSEYYNVGSVDMHHCNAGGSSTSITSGSITPTASGDLLWQMVFNANGGGSTPGAVSSFSSGSQSNITWQLLGTDIFAGSAVQAGIYNSTSAINPTFTSGTAQAFTSCTMAIKAAGSGTAPTSPFRIVHMLHQQMPKSGANPWRVQFPASGNLIVASYISGGSNISAVSSTPSNSWSSTGAQAGGENITALSQIYYAGNASTANNMTISFSRNDNSSDGTFIMYDFVGAATSPFDTDSGGQSANQTSQVSTFTTCSDCITPSVPNEVIIANAGWNWCTATNSSSPSGSLFDAATYTGTDVNGPQSVDQNNGWLHYYDPNTNPVTITWKPMNCSQPEGLWAGRVAAFMAGSSVSQQPAPPTGLSVTVN